MIGKIDSLINENKLEVINLIIVKKNSLYN